MRILLCLLTFAFLSLFSATATETGGPKSMAQDFYDGYMKVLLGNGDTGQYVLSSKSVTPGFKKAYAKLLKEGMESDPIICGQDYPDEGFEASAAAVHGDRASVTMKSRGDTLKHSFAVTLRLIDHRWLISDTNDLKADTDD